MVLTYLDKSYECVSAEKKPHEIIIHTGKLSEGEEVVYHIYGDIDFDAVSLEDGTWTEASDSEESAVWDELDAAYQEGVDSV